jgi:hypothetical protein
MQKFCLTKGLFAQCILLILKDIQFETKKLFTTIFTSINFRLSLQIPIGLVSLVLYYLVSKSCFDNDISGDSPMVNSQTFFYNCLRLSNVKIFYSYNITNNSSVRHIITNASLPLVCRVTWLKFLLEFPLRYY